MKLVGRIPVEPLDDERLTHIERRIVAGAADAQAMQPVHASRMPLVLGFAVAAVVVLGAGLVGWKLRGGAADPTAIADTTPVEVQTDQQRSTIDIGDARIESSPATAFTVTRPGGDGVLVTMTRGKIELEVGKRGNRAPLIVRAGDTQVIVVGTHFTVDFGDGTGDVDVRVSEGVVKVVRSQQETRVAAGQEWQTTQGLVAIADVRRDATGAVIPARRTAGNVDLEIEMGTAPDLLRDRVAQIPNARIRTNGSAQGSNARVTRPVPAEGPEHIRPTATLDNPSDPNFDLKALIRRQAVMPALDIQMPSAAQAISKYRETAYMGTGDDATLALYSIAYVQALKLGRASDALATLDAYIRRFKGRKEYVAALWLRVRILCLRELDGACRQDAERYVREAGDTPTAHVAERITIAQ